VLGEVGPTVPLGGGIRLGGCCPCRAVLEHVVSVRDIRLFGDPILRTPAVPVVDFDKQLRTLVQDLGDTMLHAPGAGLAAPQIGVGLRVFTYLVDGEVGHLVNPQLVLSEQTQLGDEGCLSIPGLAFDCLRSERVVAGGFDMYGEPVVVEGDGGLARCIQHETDHLDGILFVDRLDAETRKLAMKAIREAEWSGLSTPIVKESPHPMFGRGG
jgi:peptide deformylase